MNLTKFAKSFIESRPWIGGLIQFDNFYIEVCRDYMVIGWKYWTTRMDVTDSDEHSSFLDAELIMTIKCFTEQAPLMYFNNKY
jgi:hypothetical protein